MTPGAPAGAIAVTGAACRFPGAPDLDAFWSLLREGREGLTRLDIGDLRRQGAPEHLITHPSFVPVAGVIEGQDLFDPAPFGLTDAEAALMDPQQRLFLECCWHALEHAGHGGGASAGAVGVFAGAMQSSYLASNLSNRWDPTGGGADPLGSLQTALSTQVDYLPLQAAYRLDLHGPAVAVNATCATSLVAVHMAAQSLLAGECDAAISGGASLIVPQGRGYRHVPGGIFAVDGKVRAYGAQASGIVYSQGVGAVVLRRLEDALNDGDPVLAVIHSSAMNNDGALKAGFTAPSAAGQSAVVAEALELAQLAPTDIGLVEGHGTGTALGDPIEVSALRAVFGPGPAWCGLGSVKSNIGHANAAAGIASFLKVVLALQHQMLPATLHASAPNELLDLDSTPFELITRTRPWDTPSYAAVSSFGMGGTNAHVVLGPPPTPPATTQHAGSREPARPEPLLLTVSAKDAPAATETAAAVVDALPQHRPKDVAHTLTVGRATLSHRVAVVASGSGDVKVPAGEPVDASGRAPALVWAFPGAGSARAGMGSELYDRYRVFRDVIDSCAGLLAAHGVPSVLEVITADREDARAVELAEDAGVGMPALFAVSLATARLLESWGARPDVLIGHSLGEYAAAVLTGSLDVADACRLVAVRCLGLRHSGGGGRMLALPLSRDEVEQRLSQHRDLDYAVHNGPRASVVSGPGEAVDRLHAELAAEGVECVVLRVSSATHTRMIDDVLPRVRAAAQPLVERAMDIPVVSTLTGRPTSPQELADPEYWVDQMRQRVRFQEALSATTELLGDRACVVMQVGPGATLATLARGQHPDRVVRAVATYRGPADDTGDDIALLHAAGEVWTHGIHLDITTINPPGRRVAVPGYAFQRRRLWIDPPPKSAQVESHSLWQVPSWSQAPAPSSPGTELGSWRVIGTGALAAATVDQLRRHGAEIIDDDPTHEPEGIVICHDDDATDLVDQVLAYGTLARGARSRNRPLALVQVTRSAVRIESTEPVRPDQTAVRPLPRVLDQEGTDLVWTTVDVRDSERPAHSAAQVVTEVRRLAAQLHSPRPRHRSGLHVAWRADLRWERAFVDWTPPAAPAVKDRPTGVAVVLGGLGDVGLTMADHLAGQGLTVLLTSRQGAPTPAEPDRLRSVQELARRGRDVRVHRVDSTDVTAVSALLEEACTLGPLAVVVHAAGVVGSADLRPLALAGIEEVHGHVQAKALGVRVLDEALRDLPHHAAPVSIILMSSAGALVGGVGTGPYVASNAYLDGFAENCASRSRSDPAAAETTTHWTSIVWDAWKVGPLGSERDTKVADALDAPTGMRALDGVLASHREGITLPLVVVSPTDVSARMRSVDEVARPAKTSPSGEPMTTAEREVAALWSELFGRPVEDGAADFFALGGHSLLATRMLSSLRASHGVEITLRELLARPTVAGVAAALGAAGPAKTQVVAAPEPQVLPPVVTPGRIPMTRVQHAYWVGRSGGYALGGTTCSFYLEFDCADLDLARYQAAWRQVIDRHPMLRAIATADGDFEVLEDVPPYRIRTHDLRDRSPDEAEHRLGRLRTKLSAGPGPGDRWPLVQIQAAHLADGRTRLFISVDVLICDAGSFWIIDRELRSLYHDPHTPLPPLRADVAQVVHAMEGRRESSQWERSATYWRDRWDSLPPAASLPLKPTSGDSSRFVRHEDRLNAQAWSAFAERAAQQGVTSTAALLAAYVMSLSRWTRDTQLSLTLTLFDRPPVAPGVNDVVGDFTSLLIHGSRPHESPTFLELARATQQTLFEDLDHRAFSSLDMLSERARTNGLATPGVAVVFTSAIGLEDLVGEEYDPQWVGTQVAALSQTPQVLLDHQVLVRRGELLLQWDALESALDQDEVAAVFAGHVDLVRSLAHDADAWLQEPPTREWNPTYAALPLRTGTSPRHLFLIHPSGGDVLSYAALAERLDTDLNITALTDPALVDGPLSEGIDAMASMHAAAITSIQPEGPYVLGGWSMGGSLGQEVARQLTAAGREVELLLMIDSNDPSHIREIGPGVDADAELLVRQLGALEAYLDIDLGVGTQEQRHQLAALGARARLDEVVQRMRQHALLGRAEDLTTRTEVFARHLRALGRHHPRRLDGAAATLLFVADHAARRNSGIGMGVDDTPPGLADLGWAEHLPQPPIVHRLPADHYSIMRAPHIDTLAELLNPHLPRR